MPHEQVSVLELAQEAARSLTAQAAAKAVHISVTGTAGTVFGVRRLLYEIARNLCENAVKYNVPGGSVTVEVAETDRGRDPLGSGYRHRHPGGGSEPGL